MSPRKQPQPQDVTRFPRVSGDEPFCGIVRMFSWLFSPRERG